MFSIKKSSLKPNNNPNLLKDASSITPYTVPKKKTEVNCKKGNETIKDKKGS